MLSVDGIGNHGGGRSTGTLIRTIFGLGWGDRSEVCGLKLNREYRKGFIRVTG